jgi:hypothetical protein
LAGRSSAGLSFAAALLVVSANQAAAQEKVLNWLNLDRLQIVSLGAAIGRVQPSQLEPATIYALQADYGEIAPAWRVTFGASYWESRFRDKVIQAFVDSLQKSLSDPTTRVVASPVSLYDVTFSADTRYTVQYSGEIKPFAGVGIAAHVINAEGKLIKGTFVERALDDIAAGIYVTTGFTLRLVRHFGVEGSVRGDLLSGFRSTQVRAGATYYFGRIHGSRPGGAIPR